MADVHYGVVRQDGSWIIIGEHLKFGAYKRRAAAVRAAQRLGDKSCGLPFHLHVQDELGAELRECRR
jgi:hypothetical protein